MNAQIALRRWWIGLWLVLAACSPAAPIQPATSTAAPPTLQPSETPLPSPTPTAAPIPVSAPIHGINYRSSRAGYYAHPGSDWMLREHLLSLGTNWIRLEALSGCTQVDILATEITCDPAARILGGADLEHIVSLAHDLGMRVFLEPEISFSASSSYQTSEIGFAFADEDWDRWFTEYEAFLRLYAQDAQALKIDMFSIGVGLSTSVLREAEWRDLIAAVRQEYSGPILYSAINRQEWTAIRWWDALDLIGIQPHAVVLSDTDSPSVEDLQTAWAEEIELLERLAADWDRPLVITDLGYESVDGISREPGNRGHVGQVDLQEQADLVEATFLAFDPQPWFQGIFWSSYEALGTLAGPYNSGETPNNKPAEDIIRSYYGAAPQPPLPEPAPIDFNVGQDIYREGLSNSWEAVLSAEGSELDLNNLFPSLGARAIRVSLGPHGELKLINAGGGDLSDYQYLEFFIEPSLVWIWGDEGGVTGNRPLRLEVYLEDPSGFPLPYRVEFSHSRYLEGGSLKVHKWQRVRIPLAVFGPSDQVFRAIVIRNSGRLLAPDIHLDSIRLWGGQ